ncbi:MAG TPA: bifunctional glutamate N-acetyltransferase/amino-acid acetyltransferase ArgJ [Fimbriimonadaceae bacterium]|nr:bifunctional glutamate N-acetyltransferase/amino-acid acetyltransferase ArgJ [Fimbriimonadaceae bacterium]HRJ96312.1 bifunctional glutamate N-acetyltransferase/amino-acid acetyltransferase ArgJ [Fimbriimonadaceae bacterium]
MAVIPKGFLLGGARCGLKNRRNDIGLLVCDGLASGSGVFTTNTVRAACVDYTRAVIADGRLRALVVNSGNANCCTGEQGERDTARMAELAADAIGCRPEEVAVASTGIIGHLLDMARVERGIAAAGQALGGDPKPFMDAILTTDLVEKSARAETGGGVVYGVAKGSGMIAPNMATMLAFVMTDFAVDPDLLGNVWRRVSGATFNRLTVDGDTSTNDMALVFASGASGVRPAESDLEAALTEVCLDLTRQIARDGEGATKLVEVVVTGSADPLRIARTIAESPLVKTAMFGCDPNWGRILMAAGRSGVLFDPQTAILSLRASGEDHTLFEGGSPAGFDAKRVSTALKSDHVVIDLRLGEGETATIYTCDFGYGYVRINAEYHT